jgi:hypothetical protein
MLRDWLSLFYTELYSKADDKEGRTSPPLSTSPPPTSTTSSTSSTSTTTTTTAAPTLASVTNGDEKRTAPPVDDRLISSLPQRKGIDVLFLLLFGHCNTNIWPMCSF